MRSPPPHKLTNGIFSKLKAVEKSASLIVEALYSGVKNILRRARTRCKDRISRVFPAFLAAIAAAARNTLPQHASGSFFVPTRTMALNHAS
ncbi:MULTISPECIES: hypothetical protein [unclassified Paraburkholderia]|uniref:hypothetical protein n=1 Tax=unclassified Paraburkholderia TaxID=2615204 RepID=UPI00197D5032|nr:MULTISPECIES: hypothetical protein [unclassified Paraburkholderia]MBN3855931.1 hypothetical protein [Paraburkholderia sp. Ac-20340]